MKNKKILSIVCVEVECVSKGMLLIVCSLLLYTRWMWGSQVHAGCTEEFRINTRSSKRGEVGDRDEHNMLLKQRQRERELAGWQWLPTPSMYILPLSPLEMSSGHAVSQFKRLCKLQESKQREKDRGFFSVYWQVMSEGQLTCISEFRSKDIIWWKANILQNN